MLHGGGCTLACTQDGSLRPLTLPAFILALSLAAHGPVALQVGTPVPRSLDLRQASVDHLILQDARQEAHREAVQQAWRPLLDGLQDADSVRLLLPLGATRKALLLAAAQAIKARYPAKRIYVAWQPGAPPMLDEDAWGAVEGGALLSEDLGAEAATWLTALDQAQSQCPGRPWMLWTPSDPRALAGRILGNGGHLVLPPKGPTADLLRSLPEGFEEVEGGLGDITFRSSRPEGPALRFLYSETGWNPATLPKESTRVTVTGEDRYDLGALLAKIRAAQLRDQSSQHTLRSTVDTDLHFQAEGAGGDLGFTFEAFQKVGEPLELLRRETRVNGVRAHLGGQSQFPMIEARISAAPPITLVLNERYRYSDGGPAGPGQRRLRFVPVDRQAELYEGELTVDESTGRILEERSSRTNLPGVVRSEDRTVTYGSGAPGHWGILRVRSHERWLRPDETQQVLRDIRFHDFRLNPPDFEEQRNAVRASDGAILQGHPDGLRYFVKGADGQRVVEPTMRTRITAVGGMVLLYPKPLPLFGYLAMDTDAFGRGNQYFLIVAGVYNQLTFTVPKAFVGLDLSGQGTLSLIGATQRPSKDGQELDRDGVQVRTQNLNLGLGRDLGAGFRLDFKERLTLNSYSQPAEGKYRTPDFLYPRSGLTRFELIEGRWQAQGFWIKGNYGQGQRPDSTFGAPGALEQIAEEGRFTRWENLLGYDRDLGTGHWLNVTLGQVSGKGFDRFQSIEFDGRVAGIKPNLLIADRLQYGRVSLAIPTGPSLRLTLGLDHGLAHCLPDQKTYAFTGARVTGDLPGFGWFTTIGLDLGVGLQSDIHGGRTVTGSISFTHLF